MKKLNFLIVLAIFAFPVFSQELGISVEQFLILKKNSVEKTSDDDKLFNRRYFVFKHHPDDPNYMLIHIQDYEGRYYFINNKLYSYTNEYRYLKEKWSTLLREYVSKYEYYERSNNDSYWTRSIIQFVGKDQNYTITIRIPTRNYRNSLGFAVDEAVVTISGTDKILLAEYENAKANVFEKAKDTKIILDREQKTLYIYFGDNEDEYLVLRRVEVNRFHEIYFDQPENDTVIITGPAGSTTFIGSNTYSISELYDILNTGYGSNQIIVTFKKANNSVKCAGDKLSLIRDFIGGRYD
jgi:hypothetical protein